MDDGRFIHRDIVIVEKRPDNNNVQAKIRQQLQAVQGKAFLQIYIICFTELDVIKFRESIYPFPL